VLTIAARHVQNCIFVTVPTALNEAILDSDLSQYASDNDSDTKVYGWYQDLRPSTCRAVYEKLLERNHPTRRVAAKHNIPLVDWFAMMRTTSTDDFNVDFFDLRHPRTSAYPKIARMWREALNRYL
jgi:hypothetical protein